MRRRIQNWEVGSQCPQYPQYPSYPQYPQWGGGSKIEKLVPNILNILKEDDDPKLEGWFPISSISSISSKRRMIPNWEVGSQYHQYPQYPQRGGWSQIGRLVPNIINILNILKEEDDLKLGSWFPISVFDWDSDAPVDIRPTVTDNHERDDHR